MNTTNTLGSRIRFYRKKNKIKQKELAEKVGLSSGDSISKIENDFYFPSYNVLYKISKVLNVSLDDLTIDYLTKNNSGFNDLSPKHHELFDTIDFAELESIKKFYLILQKYNELK